MRPLGKARGTNQIKHVLGIFFPTTDRDKIDTPSTHV
jgi:hypothetical protein